MSSSAAKLATQRVTCVQSAKITVDEFGRSKETFHCSSQFLRAYVRVHVCVVCVSVLRHFLKVGTVRGWVEGLSYCC